MKREIKFRAWDTLNNVMSKSFKLGQMPRSIRNNGVMYALQSYELMQFTGLKDKNGREIYEGDVVKWDDQSNGDYWRVCAISWEKSHYVLNGYSTLGHRQPGRRNVKFKFGQFAYEYDGVLEVIGNIFENPELLKP